jgi:hypothetical protein
VIAASGLAIIFGVAGVINMAHGQFIMVGAYTAAFVDMLGGDMFMAIPLAFIVVAFLGLIVERGVIQWIYDRPLETLLATWGVGIIIEVVVKLIFGTLGQKVGWPDLLDGSIKIFARPPHFPYYRVFHIVLAIVILLVTFYILYRTNFGLKVRAVRRNRAMSGCLGIDTAKIDMLIFMCGSASPASPARHRTDQGGDDRHGSATPSLLHGHRARRRRQSTGHPDGRISDRRRRDAIGLQMEYGNRSVAGVRGHRHRYPRLPPGHIRLSGAALTWLRRPLPAPPPDRFVGRV